MGRKVLFVIAFMALGIAVKAQPVLTAADFGADFHSIPHSGSISYQITTSPFSATISASSSPSVFYIRSVPVSSVPNAADFPQATSASKSVNTSTGAISYSLFETTASSHKLIARGNGNGLTATDQTIFVLPFERYDECSMGTYEGYGTLTTPYGVFTNVIVIHSFTVDGDVQTNKWSYIGTNPYRFIASEYSAGGGGGSFSSFYSNEFIPYVLSSEDFISSTFSIYPIPTNHSINIHNDNVFQGEAFVSVYDMLGKVLVGSRKLESNLQTIDLQDINPGIYIVKITDNQSQVLHTQKIIKN